MEINRKELKRAARESMRGIRPNVMKVSLVYLLLSTGVSLLINFVVANPAEEIYRAFFAALNGAGYEQIITIMDSVGSEWTVGITFLNALLFFYGIALSFGYTVYTLRRTDAESAGYGTLLSGFGQLSRVVVMEFAVIVFTLAWGCLVMVPAVIVSVVVVMALIMGLGGSGLAVVLGIVFVYVVVFAAILVLVYLTGRYALAPYILADHPEIGGLEAVRRSRSLLHSRLGEVFKLSLSFLGWELLGVFLSLVAGGVGLGVMVAGYYSGNMLLMGLGAYVVVILATLVEILFQMWLLPYIQGAYAQYYRTLLPKAVSQINLEADRPEPF